MEIAVGLFLFVGLACLAFLAVRMGQISLVGEDTYVVKARFTSVSGLKEGAQVELAGVRVGKVARISLDNETYEAVVELAVDRDVRLQLDTIASIRTQGIIGDKFVKLSPGGDPGLLEPGQEILETEPSISLEELISKYTFEGGD